MNLIQPFLAVGSHLTPSDMLDTCTKGFVWCISDWAYDVTGGMFWTFMLLGFCIALLLALNRIGPDHSMAYVGFVGISGALWLVTLGLIPWYAASLFFIFGALAIIVPLIRNK